MALSWHAPRHRVWSAFKRPFELVGLLRTRPDAWRRHLRVTGAQVLMTLVVGGLLFWLSDAPEVADRSERSARRAAKAAKKAHEALQTVAAFRDGGLGAAEDLEAQRRRKNVERALQLARPFLDALGDDGGVSVEVNTALREGLDAGTPAEGLEAAVQAALQHAEEEDDDDDDDDEEEEVSGWHWERPLWLARLSAWVTLLISSLVIGQWVTLAFTREYQAPTARTVSELIGIEPEDDDAAPRFRLDLKWLRRKAGKRARGFLVVLPGFFLLAPLWLVTKVLRVDVVVMPVALFGWTAYWWLAFTAARSARAWEGEATAPAPGPVRWWVRQSERGGLWRLFFPRWIGRVATRLLRRESAPAAAMERAPVPFLGLALARAVTSIPLIRLFFRPLFDTAVAELLVQHPAPQPDATDPAA